VPMSPNVATPSSHRSFGSTGSEKNGKGASSSKTRERDVVEVNFDLDGQGRTVHVIIEFYPDGSADMNWSASNLPIPMSYVVCFVQEIDLLSELAPFVVSSGVVHQFPWNDADRLVRICSKPPIPFAQGFEAVAQRFGFDLLDTPWEGFCLVECGPDWQQSPNAGSAGHRDVPRPAPTEKAFKQVEIKTVAALGQPVGAAGQQSTIIFSGSGNLKLPRNLLPNWLIQWLIQKIFIFVYQKALERVAEFEKSAFGPRLKTSSLYATMHQRITKFSEAKATDAPKAPTLPL